jgi:hypothetical protein
VTAACTTRREPDGESTCGIDAATVLVRPACQIAMLPRAIRYAAPAYLTTVNAVADVARMTDRPNAAARVYERPDLEAQSGKDASPGSAFYRPSRMSA